ncbi:MAG: TIGR01212 family radical SAM protein [Gammaproteobacteria bacterium]|nr:TIGR01212 family radical SAM protein [Gammaproteobacteria bacterium]
MALADLVNTFGQAMMAKYAERVHKLAIDAAFTCPNRDGTKGIGGCTFCNNNSFSPNGRNPESVSEQIESGRQVICKRTRAKKYLAYFQAYTNTYADYYELKELYDSALSEPDVIGLSVGTRPDCVPDSVLDLLQSYQEKGHEIWLELGLQSSFDSTLEKVNRGHTYQDYCLTVKAARDRGINVCTHLIIGLPGETSVHAQKSLLRVLDQGVDGLKIHPLHVVKGTQLANQWRRKEYQTLKVDDYVSTTATLIEMTPAEIIYHRVTGTANNDILLAPAWCNKKWKVLNAIENELIKRGTRQGHKSENMIYGCI